MKLDTRETWLNAAASILIDELITPNIDTPEPRIRYSLTAPKTGTAKARVLGECWNKKASADDTYEVFITASLDAADSLTVLATLLHEQLHAYDGNKNRHKAPFIALCKAVGLEGGETKKSKCSFTATVPSATLTEHLNDIIATLGEIPHGALNPTDNGKKKQTNRQKLVICSAGCGFKFRASQKMIDAMTSNTCLSCQQNTLTLNRKRNNMTNPANSLDLATFKSSVHSFANSMTAPKAADKLQAINTLIDHCLQLSTAPEGVPWEIFCALTTLYRQQPTLNRKRNNMTNPAKPKTAHQWVQKAVGKKDRRSFLNQTHIEGRDIRATDGHRVHVAPHGGRFEDGYYDAALNKVEEAGKYPDIARMIPSGSKGRVKVATYTTLYNPKVVTLKGIEAAELRAPGTINSDDKGSYVMLKYLKDALSNPAEIESATIGESWADTLLLTFSDGSLAVIMPLRWTPPN